MERILAWIRDHPQFAAVGFVVAVLILLVMVLGIAMLRAGVSLRPLLWFLGFFLIVGGPQAVVHLLDGLVLQRSRSTASAEPAARIPIRSALAPVPWATVFGPEADPALNVDAKIGLGAVVGEADEARLSFNARGESALAARFGSPAAAQRALDRYGTFFAFAQASGSDTTGWTARRHQGQGEWVHVVTAGPELYAWTATERTAVLAQRARVFGPVEETSPAQIRPERAGELVSQRLTRRPGLMAVIVALNLVVAGFWFFKGTAWAARVQPVPVTLPASAATLRSALLASNRPTVPTEVVGRDDGTLEVTWRYADARWFDLMRVHHLKRMHRLVLQLHEPSRTVRVREYWSRFDAAAGRDGLRLDWQAATGIQFFAFDHTRVLGAQLDRDGRPTGELSRSYTFNLQELKAPYIAEVTQAGWRWQPVVWNAPAALRWLTE